MCVCQADAYSKPCAGLTEAHIKLGYYSIRNSVESVIGRAISEAVHAAIEAIVVPRLLKLTKIASEALPSDSGHASALSFLSALSDRM